MFERKQSDAGLQSSLHDKIEMKEQYSAAELLDLVQLAATGMLSHDETVAYTAGARPLDRLFDLPGASLVGQRLHAPFLPGLLGAIQRRGRVYVPNDPNHVFHVNGRQEYQYQQNYRDGVPTDFFNQLAPRTTGDVVALLHLGAGEHRPTPYSAAMSFFIPFQPEESRDGRLSIAKVKIPALPVNWWMTVLDDTRPQGKFEKTISIETSLFINVATTAALNPATPPAYAPPTHFPINNNATRKVVFKTKGLIPSETYGNQFDRIDLDPVEHSFVAEAGAAYLIEIGLMHRVICSSATQAPETARLILDSRTQIPLVSLVTQKLPL